MEIRRGEGSRVGKHGSGPAGWLLLFPTTALGWELEQCSPLLCHVSRPRAQWCLLTLPLGPEVLPWVGLSGKVLTEDEAWAGNPPASRLRGRDGPPSMVAAGQSQHSQAWEGTWGQNRELGQSRCKPRRAALLGISLALGLGG